MTVTTPPVSPQAIADLRDLYAFRDAEFEVQDVPRFLNLHPHLVPLLLEARPIIARHFGPDIPVRLEVVLDPESEAEDGDAQLFAMIETQLSPEEARPRLDRFDQEWWLSNLRRADCRLEFSIRYLRSNDRRT